MRKNKPKNLAIPGMKAKRFPDKAKQVDMSAWRESPLYKASVRAEVEKVQGAARALLHKGAAAAREMGLGKQCCGSGRCL